MEIIAIRTRYGKKPSIAIDLSLLAKNRLQAFFPAVMLILMDVRSEHDRKDPTVIEITVHVYSLKNAENLTI